jgi:hypothetical protein
MFRAAFHIIIIIRHSPAAPSVKTSYPNRPSQLAGYSILIDHTRSEMKSQARTHPYRICSAEAQQREYIDKQRFSKQNLRKLPNLKR